MSEEGVFGTAKVAVLCYRQKPILIAMLPLSVYQTVCSLWARQTMSWNSKISISRPSIGGTVCKPVPSVLLQVTRNELLAAKRTISKDLELCLACPKTPFLLLPFTKTYWNHQKWTFSCSKSSFSRISSSAGHFPRILSAKSLWDWTSRILPEGLQWRHGVVESNHQKWTLSTAKSSF